MRMREPTRRRPRAFCVHLLIGDAACLPVSDTDVHNEGEDDDDNECDDDDEHAVEEEEEGLSSDTSLLQPYASLSVDT